ncbi:MAG TPA: hypothetical protein VF832_10445 [Longimicrobiales bacterium]
MANPFAFLARAAAGLNLTPLERAARKLLRTAGYAFLVGVAGVATPLIATGHFSISGSTVQAVIGGGLVAVAVAVEKWYTAQADSPLAPPAAP